MHVADEEPEIMSSLPEITHSHLVEQPTQEWWEAAARWGLALRWNKEQNEARAAATAAERSGGLPASLAA